MARFLLVGFLLSTAPVPTGAAPGEPPRRHVPLLLAQYFFFGSTTLAQSAGDLVVQGQTLSVTAMAGGRLAGIRSIIAGSLQYDLTRVEHHGGGGTPGSESLHSVFGRLAMLHSLSKTWGWMLFLRVGLSSDFGRLSWSDARAATGAAVTYARGDHLKVDFGFTYTNNFLGDLVLPLINLQLRRERLRLEILVPRGGELSFAIRPEIELGVRANALSYRYGLHSPSSLGIEFAQINVYCGPFVRVYLHRGVFLTGEGGYNVQYTRVRRDAVQTLSLLTFAGGYASLSAGYMY
jgi:hypothetical protein